MDKTVRKNLNEFWLTSNDLLKLEEHYIQLEHWLMCFSTHELAKRGFRAKITSNARSLSIKTPEMIAREAGMYDDSALEPLDIVKDRDICQHCVPVLSEQIHKPLRNIGKTKIRFYQPNVSHTAFNLSIYMKGFYFNPETVFSDLQHYDYWTRAGMSVKVRHPTIKTAEQILDEVPFELLLRAHTERMKKDIGDYRPEPPKFDMSKVLHLKRLKEARRKKFAPPLKEEKYA